LNFTIDLVDIFKDNLCSDIRLFEISRRFGEVFEIGQRDPMSDQQKTPICFGGSVFWSTSSHSRCHGDSPTGRHSTCSMKQ
jgi:hypothetical protein